MAHRLFAAATFGHMPETLIYGSAPAGLSFPYPDGNGSGNGSGSGSGAPQVLGQAWFDTMAKANPLVPSVLLTGTHMRDRKRFAASVRSKALRHVHELRAAYDRALDGFDVLVMPATPTVGLPHPDTAQMSAPDLVEFVLSHNRNNEPFNLTGHPAFVIPVGWGRVGGGAGAGDAKLPVGMQIVGRRWDEEKLFLAAAAWEVGGWGLDEE